MKKITLMFLCAGLAVAQDKPATKLETVQQELNLTKLEALVLREQLATQQVDKIRAEQQTVYGEACVAAGLKPDPKLCLIDLNARTVTKRPEPAPEKK